MPKADEKAPAPSGNESYKYDGGPTDPVPLPQGDNKAPSRVEPKPLPRPSVPLEGRAVSIPAPTKEPELRFRAYGEEEKPQSTERTILIRRDSR